MLPVLTLRAGLYASPLYVAQHGCPESGQDLSGHRFVGPDADAPATPYLDWLRVQVPPQGLCFRSNSIAVLWDAVRAGLGIGFVPEHLARESGLVPVLPSQDAWREPVWAVTHVDLHRTARIQAFVRVLKRSPSAV